MIKISIAQTELFRTQWGDKAVVCLLITDSSAGTADEVETGLGQVQAMFFGSDKSTTVMANAVVHNEDIPFNGGTVTVRMNASDVVNALFIGQL